MTHPYKGCPKSDTLMHHVRYQVTPWVLDYRLGS